MNFSGRILKVKIVVFHECIWEDYREFSRKIPEDIIFKDISERTNCGFL